MPRLGRARRADVIPDTLFSGLARLLPFLNKVAQECDLTVGEWIVLWEFKERGVLDRDNQIVLLRQDLTQSLSSRGFGDANIARIVSSLEDKAFVRRVGLSASERDRLFGAADRETRLAVALQPSGEAKIEQFKEELTERIASWRHRDGRIPNRKTVTAAAKTALKLADWFLKTAEGQSNRKGPRQ